MNSKYALLVTMSIPKVQNANHKVAGEQACAGIFHICLRDRPAAATVGVQHIVHLQPDLSAPVTERLHRYGMSHNVPCRPKSSSPLPLMPETELALETDPSCRSPSPMKQARWTTLRVMPAPFCEVTDVRKEGV